MVTYLTLISSSDLLKLLLLLLLSPSLFVSCVHIYIFIAYLAFYSSTCVPNVCGGGMAWRGDGVILISSSNIHNYNPFHFLSLLRKIP